LWCVHREFSYELISERLLKSGPHAKVIIKHQGVPVYFFETAAVYKVTHWAKTIPAHPTKKACMLNLWRTLKPETRV